MNYSIHNSRKTDAGQQHASYVTIEFLSAPPLNDDAIAHSNAAIGQASASSGFTSTFPLASSSMTLGSSTGDVATLHAHPPPGVPRFDDAADVPEA